MDLPHHSYAYYEAEWNAAQELKRDHSLITPKKRPTTGGHPLSYKDLVLQLAYLRKLTKDPRFFELFDAVLDHDLVNNGKWRRNWTPKDKWDPKPDIVRAIALRLNRGDSLRLACAYIAFDFDIEANSFLAAVDRLERWWRSSELCASVPPRSP